MKIGFAMCGSFCTFQPVLCELERFCNRFEDVVPIMSEISGETDSRFGTAEEHIARLTNLCGRRPLKTIQEAEPIGPRALLDLLVIAPCTGNTLGKMACGITDSVVTMAAKAQLRNGRPVLIAVSTNDGLGASGKNIMELMGRRNIYFVPFGQDDSLEKPDSLKADMTRITEAAEAALMGRQLQPVLIEYKQG